MDLDQLEALARNATPGGWWSDFNGCIRTKTASEPAFSVAFANPAQGKQTANAQFIAAANPEVMLRLIARLRAAEALLEDVPRALQAAGADLIAEESWKARVAASRGESKP